MPKHYILVPLGTTGDVNPFLWIGSLLRKRGHEVTLLSHTVLTQPKKNFDFCSSSCNRNTGEALLKNPQLWHPWHGIRLLFSFAGDWTEQTFVSIQACVRPDMENILVAPPTSFGARLARERLGLPLATVHLQPCAIHSLYENSKMQRGFEWMAILHWIWKHFFSQLPTPIEFYAGPGVRRACRAQQIRPPRHLLNQWWHSPDGVLCLFPNWFAKPQRDWPARCTQTGFPLYDTTDEFIIPADLQNFLDSGPPPLLFTLGSATEHSGNFFEVALKVCTRLKRRALFLSPLCSSSLPFHSLPAHIFACQKYIPFSWLFSKIEAVVHHAGIGTLSQALAAGVPQLVIPLSFDQPDNAARLVKLGTARVIYPSQLTVEKVSKELNIILTNKPIKRDCASYSQKFSLKNTSAYTLDFLENLTLIS